MVQQGAGNVVFLSRSGTKKPEAKTVIAELTLKGAKVATYECDVSNSQQVQDVVRQCAQEFPPIRGVIQGAMVLKVLSGFRWSFSSTKADGPNRMRYIRT